MPLNCMLKIKVGTFVLCIYFTTIIIITKEIASLQMTARGKPHKV